MISITIQVSVIENQPTPTDQSGLRIQQRRLLRFCPAPVVRTNPLSSDRCVDYAHVCRFHVARARALVCVVWNPGRVEQTGCPHQHASLWETDTSPHTCSACVQTQKAFVPSACNMHELIRGVCLLNYLCSFTSALFGFNCSAYSFEVQRTD